MTDLFDFIPEIAAERQAQALDLAVSPLLVLRDAMPEAFCVVAYRDPERCRLRGAKNPGASGPWAYSLDDAGLYWDHRSEFRGWDRIPTHLTTWSQLDAAFGHDPRLADLIDWHESLPEPNWQETYRPHELWPDPEDWHPSYLEHDHQRPGWEARKNAWHTLRAILTDAIARAEA